MKRNELAKRELSRSIKELAKLQALSAVTISGLCKYCGISRGTFYYHFIDIYDLINWTFEYDIIKPLQAHISQNSRSGWNGITKYCIQRMYDNRDFYCQAVRLECQNSLKAYMLERNLDSWRLLIGKYIAENKLNYDEKLLDFMVRYTSQAVANMTIEWARDGMNTAVDIMAMMDDVATMGIYGVLNTETQHYNDCQTNPNELKYP